MKKYLSIFIALIFIIGIMPIKSVKAEEILGTTYYVDYSTGNDENEGTSENKAWRSLEKVNSQIFKPGDKILFKSGETWTGVLNPKGSGCEGKPIIIDKYGGEVKPRFVGEENAPHVFYLYNEEYWEINNLDISANYTSPLERRAVRIKAEDKGVVDHIYLNGLDIHDVQINLKYPNSNAYKTSGGIFVEITGNSVPTKYDDLVIENCTIQNVDRTGIQLLWSSWSNRGGANTGSGRWYPSTNVVVKNNLIKSTAGDGIVVQGTDGAIIEHNIIDDFAARNQGVAYNCAAWSHNSDNTVFRYNTGLNGNTTKDGMPWDSDGYSNGTIFEYNYSKNNEGGAYLIISYGEGASPTGLADSRDSIFRYNISENDRFALMTMTNPVGNHKVYNNVFYVGPERQVDAFFYGNMSHKDIGVNFANNIFYVDEKDGKSGSLNGNWATKFEYDSNIYYSKQEGGISKLPKDPNKIIEDPMFVAAGTGEDGYKVMENSPAINAGKYIVDNGENDYYGNKLYNGAPDIGVHEYSDTVFDLVSREKSIEDNFPKEEVNYEHMNKEVNATNLIVNGDFESSQSINSSAGKNTWYKNSNNIGIIASEYKKDGNYGLMVKNHASGGSFVNYQPVLKEKTTYKLIYDAKKVSGNPKPLQIKWFDSDSSLNNGYDGGVGAQLSNEWKTYEVEFSTGEAFKNNEPPIIFIASTPNGEIWIDNVKLIEIGAATPDGGDIEEEAFDLTKVKELLNNAEGLLSNIVVGEEVGQTPEKVVNRLKKAIDIGKEVIAYENSGMSKQAQDDMEVLLERAIDAAERSKITENTGDIDNVEGITIADLAYAIKFMGKQVDLFNENWNEAKYSDFDGDDRVDFEDIMKLANIISNSNNIEDSFEEAKDITSIKVGDMFEVIYTLNDLNNLISQDLNVKYDTDVLELVSFNTTIGYKDGVLDKGVKRNYHSFLNNKLDDGNNIILSADRYSNALNGDTPIMSLQFKAIGGGSTNIVAYDNLVDVNGNLTSKTTILKEAVTVDDVEIDKPEDKPENKPENKPEDKPEDIVQSKPEKEESNELPKTGGVFMGIPIFISIGLVLSGIKLKRK